MAPLNLLIVIQFVESFYGFRTVEMQSFKKEKERNWTFFVL